MATARPISSQHVSSPRPAAGWLRRALPLAWLIGLALLPLIVTDEYVIRICNVILIYSLLSIGQNVITGYTGMLSLGHAAFFGIGAYASALLVTQAGWPFPAALLAAALLACLCGVAVALPCLRVQSDFLSLVTIAFGSLFTVLALNWITLTRGPMGLTAIPTPRLGPIDVTSNRDFYYLFLGIVAVAYWGTERIAASQIGRSWKALRDDELSAAAMGVDVTYYKVLAFAVGTFLAGVAGSLLAHYFRFIGPENFSFNESLLTMEMAILGGLASMPGAVLGAAIFIAVPELLRSEALLIYRVGIGGLVMIVCMIWRPQGLLGQTGFGQTGASSLLQRWRGQAPAEPEVAGAPAGLPSALGEE